MKSLYQLHWTVDCRILRYLKEAPCKGLYYHPSSHLDIVGYFDVDWADDPIDRHFTTDYTEANLLVCPKTKRFPIYPNESEYKV